MHQHGYFTGQAKEPLAYNLPDPVWFSASGTFHYARSAAEPDVVGIFSAIESIDLVGAPYPDFAAIFAGAATPGDGHPGSSIFERLVLSFERDLAVCVVQ
jgi:hypothetical protein